MNDITYFAKTNFRNQQTVFGIKRDDRRRHMYIIGKTGMGKTTLLEHLVLQDIRNGHGVAYVDPHGDTAEKIIRMIPPERINDVIYFNPADQLYPISFNIMENVSPDFRHLVSSGLIGVFKKLWADSWGPRLEYILRNALLALLEYPGSTILGVMRILTDKKFREKVLEHVQNPAVKAFWVDEFSKWNDKALQEVVSPIQNKVGQFISTDLIRNMIGQADSSFNIREVMDQKKILILNLSKGHIGEDSSALLGAMMVTKIQLAAMGRVDMPEEERNDFYLYVDEFQNFATESFANILSEARKYRLNLILANQYITQLQEEVRDAIFGNVGTILSFRVGAMDAEFLEKEFEPVFMMNDLVNLPKYSIYLKLMIDGIAGDAFSAMTLAPISVDAATDSAEKVIRVSRERYASKKSDVEEKIRKWSGMRSREEIDRQVARQRFFDKDSDDIKNNTFSSVKSYSIQEQFSNSFNEGKKIGGAGRETIGAGGGLVLSQQKMDQGAIAVKDPGEQLTERNSENAVPQKYPATCHSCGMAIEVPFKPDGKRPTFCRECLREYQRYTAKSRELSSSGTYSVQQSKTRTSDDQTTEKNYMYEPVVYTDSGTQPIKLSQIATMSPRKFISSRKIETEKNIEQKSNEIIPNDVSQKN